MIPKPGGPDPIPLGPKNGNGPHCPGPEPFGPIRFKNPYKGV